MVKVPSILDLFKAGVHFGHRASKSHPKMLPFIYTTKNNTHLIDLEKTRERLKQSLDFIKKLISHQPKAVILFVGTKPAARQIIEKYAQEVVMPYIIEQWLGGTLTNFAVIHQRIEEYKKMLKEKEEGAWEKYTKKESLLLERNFQKLEKLFKGISTLDALPDALYVIDILEESTTVREANKKQIPVIALTGTNTNPEQIAYPIPGNDDGIKSIELITQLIVETIKEGRESQKPAPNSQEKK